MKLQQLGKRVNAREKELSGIIFIAQELAKTYGIISNPYEGEYIDSAKKKKHYHTHIELRNFGHFHFIVDQDCNVGDDRVRIFTNQPNAEVFSVSLYVGIKVEVYDEHLAWKSILDLTWRTRKQIAKSANIPVKMVTMRQVQKRLTVKEFTQQYNSLLEKAKELGMTV